MAPTSRGRGGGGRRTGGGGGKSRGSDPVEIDEDDDDDDDKEHIEEDDDGSEFDVDEEDEDDEESVAGRRGARAKPAKSKSRGKVRTAQVFLLFALLERSCSCPHPPERPACRHRPGRG